MLLLRRGRLLSTALPRLSQRADALRRQLPPPPPSAPPPPPPAAANSSNVIDTLAEAQLSDAGLTKRDFTRALKASDHWRDTQLVLRSMEHEGIAPGPFDLALAAHAFARDGRHGLAKDIQSQLVADGGSLLRRADPRTLTLVLRGHAISRDAPGALRVWECARSGGLWPTLPGLQHLLVACADKGMWREALAALREAEGGGVDGIFAAYSDDSGETASEGRAPSEAPFEVGVRQWNAVLKACVNADEYRQAEGITEQMRAVEGYCQPDVTSYNTLLHGYALDWGGGEGLDERIERSEALLGIMDEYNVERDEVTYSALLDVHKLNPPKVLELLAEARRTLEGGIKWPSTYAKAVRSLWWAGLPDHARQLTESMEANGILPDRGFYERVILAAESAGLQTDADRLHREAQRRGLLRR